MKVKSIENEEITMAMRMTKTITKIIITMMTMTTKMGNWIKI